METLIISIPDSKSAMVKKVLQALGVDIKLAKAQPEKISARNLLGLVSLKDAKLMEAAIAEACEQVNEDDWK